VRADLDLDGAVAAGGADEFPVSVRGAIMIGGQKIQVGLSHARKTRVGSISAQRDRVGVAVALVRVPPTRPMSSAPPRGLHAGTFPFRACGRPEMR